MAEMAMGLVNFTKSQKLHSLTTVAMVTKLYGTDICIVLCFITYIHHK